MASETFADELRAAVSGDKRTLYTELMLQAAELLDEKMYSLTPVAPVSPDATGKCGELVTVGYGYVNSLGELEYAAPTASEMRSTPLCLRSQAVELLAEAERRNSELERELTGVRNSYFEEKKARLADNAALTARVKELEADVKREARSSTHNAQDCLDEQLRAEALEAKLAAAERALEPFAEHANDRAVDDTGWRDKETVKIVVSIGDLRKARAALGGKPS
jgi:hypothetical protein|nr:hypothetical protein [Brucella anthropi]